MTSASGRRLVTGPPSARCGSYRTLSATACRASLVTPCASCDIASRDSCIILIMALGRGCDVNESGPEGGQQDGGLNRRQFMMRAGMVGVTGAVAWTAPQILSASPAAAAGGSAPPQPRPRGANTDVQGSVDRRVTPVNEPNNTVLAETLAKPATPSAPHTAPATGPASL